MMTPEGIACWQNNVLRRAQKNAAHPPADAVCVYCNRPWLQEHNGILWCSYCGTLATFDHFIGGEDWYMGYQWFFPHSFDLDDVADPPRDASQKG